MKKLPITFLVGALALLVFFLAAPSVESAGAPPALTARATGVALYARQDADTERIATLEEGEVLFPMAEAIGTETWYMVRTKRGLIGWIRGVDVVASSETREAFKEREGTSTWSARSAEGRTFNGTWSVSPSSNHHSASGGWTLSDGKGTTIMRGTWSADKHDTGWNGIWRAALEGGKGEHSGSWSSEFPHTRNATFADFFAAAAKDALRGLWTGGSTSGSWSIRAAAKQ
ncbi:MAG TPA: hypothetical protein VJQ55_07760 [Candidatus Binatia bacterium]|nr:hypothetical protein [Candidatus Binatia bacterium]